MFGFYKTGFGLFPGVLEGSGSSGRLVGSISTYPGSNKCPWSRVVPPNPPFLPSTVCFIQTRIYKSRNSRKHTHTELYISTFICRRRNGDILSRFCAIIQHHGVGKVLGYVEMIPTSLPELPEPSRAPEDCHIRMFYTS